MASLKTLRIKALKTENEYLQATVVKLREKLRNYAVNDTQISILGEKLDKAFETIQEKDSALESYRQMTKDLSQDVMNALVVIPFEMLFSTNNLRCEFQAHVEAGEHITCIKMLRNNAAVAMGLKQAKDLYESKYRNLQKYPMQQAAQPEQKTKIAGVFEPGDRVVCINGVPHYDLHEGQIYTIMRENSTASDEVFLQEVGNHSSWKKTRFQHAN